MIINKKEIITKTYSHTLELNDAEMIALGMLCGSVIGSGPLRDLYDNIYHHAEKINEDKIMNLYNLKDGTIKLSDALDNLQELTIENLP